MRPNPQPRLRSVAVLLSGREPFSPYFGGAVARWTYEVYSLLTDQLAVTVFGFPTGKKTQYAMPHETNQAWRLSDLVSRIPLARRYEENLWLRALLGRLREFSIVHIHNRPQWVGMLRRMGYRGAVILHLHNDHLGHWSAAHLDGLASMVDAVAVCSGYLRSTFAARSAVLDAKIHVVYNGANPQLFFPREEIREPGTILFVGRFDPEKGVLQLLQAYEKVSASHPHAKLVIAGTTGFGSHRETAYVRQVYELAERLTREKDAQIYFTGYLHHDNELPVWFQKATIFACPSLFQEPFGMVNTEAMACSTPVVAANRGGIPEVLGDAGRLIDPENITEFAAALSGLLANPSACRTLGFAGYQRCRTLFTWRSTAAAWMKLIEELPA